MCAKRYAAIKWTDAQVQRLERAVNDYNDAIDDAAARYGGGVSLLLPRKTTVAEEIDRIDTSSQLNARVNSLNRIHRPGALDIDLDRQMTNYEYHEGVVAKSTINRWRMQRIKQLGGELKKRNGKLVPADMRTRQIVNETSLMPYQEEVTAANAQRLMERANELSGGNIVRMRTYYINYIRQWTAYFSWTPEYEKVLDIINSLMKADVGTINNVFYSYDYYGTFDYLYDEGDRTPIARKAKNIYRYWLKQQEKWGF